MQDWRHTRLATPTHSDKYRLRGCHTHAAWETSWLQLVLHRQAVREGEHRQEDDRMGPPTTFHASCQVSRATISYAIYMLTNIQNEHPSTQQACSLLHNALQQDNYNFLFLSAHGRCPYTLLPAHHYISAVAVQQSCWSREAKEFPVRISCSTNVSPKAERDAVHRFSKETPWQTSPAERNCSA